MQSIKIRIRFANCGLIMKIMVKYVVVKLLKMTGFVLVIEGDEKKINR